MDKSPGHPKTHGLSRGLNFQQTITLLVISAEIYIFGFVLAPHFEPTPKIVLSSIFSLSTFLLIVFALIATFTDPTDEVIILERKAKAQGIPFDSAAYEFQCEICVSSVSSNTKHCRACGRCVSGFDHHCEWLNNCISKKNYRAFAALIACVGLSTLSFIVSSILFIVDYYTGSVRVIAHREIVRAEDFQDWAIILISIFTTILVILLLLDIQLILFHLYLYKNDMTTYDYIVKGREAQREKQSKRKNSLSLKKKQILNQVKKGGSSDLEAEDGTQSDKENHKSTSDSLKSKGSFHFNKSAGEAQSKDTTPSTAKKSQFSSSNSSPTKKAESDISPLPPTQPRYNLSLGSKMDLIKKYQNYDDPSSHEGRSIGEWKSDSSRLLYPNHSTSPQLSARPDDEKSSPNSPQASRDSREGKKDRAQTVKVAKVETLESKLIAVSLAKIVHNYHPQDGKILEEDNESEHPNQSHVSHDFDCSKEI